MFSERMTLQTVQQVGPIHKSASHPNCLVISLTLVSQPDYTATVGIISCHGSTLGHFTTSGSSPPGLS